MSQDEFDLDEAKKFIVKRLSTYADNYDFKGLSISEVVEKALVADEVFLNTMDFYCLNFSDDDEIRFIEDRTDFDEELIEFLLWQRYCYEMKLGLWEYDADSCIDCGDIPLVFKENSSKSYPEKLVCENCGCEMVIDGEELVRYEG